MERNPFLIEGPAVISFSGGRTSGYMLWRILQAHGGKLPDDVRVLFANTGKEMPETLDFVQECSERWAVPIVWLEYEYADGEGSHGPSYRVVDHRRAARNGEPYADLIFRRNYLPNPVARFCTTELKILTIERWCRDHPIFDNGYEVAVGLRADEPRRVSKLRANPSGGRTGYERIAPLADAGVTCAEVDAFWEASAFDLRLPRTNGKTMHGNCDLCFLKGAAQIMSLIREEPRRAVWWMQQEQRIQRPGIKDGATFRNDRPSYKSMHEMATNHGELFAFDDEPLQDCFCTE